MTYQIRPCVPTGGSKEPTSWDFGAALPTSGDATAPAQASEYTVERVSLLASLLSRRALTTFESGVNSTSVERDRAQQPDREHRAGRRP